MTRTGCVACATDRCDDCPRPNADGRLTADNRQLPTCCCGRVFREDVT